MVWEQSLHDAGGLTIDAFFHDQCSGSSPDIVIALCLFDERVFETGSGVEL